MAEVRYILAVVLSAVLFSSCINEEYEGPDPDLPVRTILVWLGGDNNLSDETGRRSRPCGRVGPTPGTNA